MPPDTPSPSRAAWRPWLIALSLWLVLAAVAALALWHLRRDTVDSQTRELGLLRAAFPSLQVEGHQLLAMAGRLLGRGGVHRALTWCDERLLAHLPGLSRYCRYAVLTCRREP